MKMLCLMLISALNVVGQPVLLIPDAQGTVLSTKKVQVLHVIGDVQSLVQKRINISVEEIRWLKIFTKKEDLVKRIKNNESKLASELRLLFATKKPAVVAVVAENKFDSVVIQLSVDAKGAHEVVIYSAAECPTWVAPLVDASAYAADASSLLVKIMAVTALVGSYAIKHFFNLKGFLSFRSKAERQSYQRSSYFHPNQKPLEQIFPPFAESLQETVPTPQKVTINLRYVQNGSFVQKEISIEPEETFDDFKNKCLRQFFSSSLENCDSFRLVFCAKKMNENINHYNIFKAL